MIFVNLSPGNLCSPADPGLKNLLTWPKRHAQTWLLGLSRSPPASTCEARGNNPHYQRLMHLPLRGNCRQRERLALKLPLVRIVRNSHFSTSLFHNCSLYFRARFLKPTFQNRASRVPKHQCGMSAENDNERYF